MNRNNKLIKEICQQLNLGKLKRKPKRVAGGFMHKMYRLHTQSGDYALKLLNPEIMKRPDVFENYKVAENLEQCLEDNGLPIVAALEYNGRKMQCIHNRYYYIFNWVNGKSRKPEDIKPEHCIIIADLLAKIHTIHCEVQNTAKQELDIDWDFYIEQSKTKCPKITQILSENKNLLYKSQQEGNLALNKLPNITCISNGDMDSKNVLWMNNKPQIIDLECLNYGNPFVEMFQLALCWSGYEECKIDFSRFESFLKSYLNRYGKIQMDCEALYYSNTGRLEWLEYNIKRALMIECENRQERKLGINQVKETMEHIIYYDKIRNKLISCLKKYLS